MGSIGLDIDNFGTKKGSFSYTLTAEDFNYSSYGVTTTIADADESGDIGIGDYTLDINEDGHNDVKDKIVLNLDGEVLLQRMIISWMVMEMVKYHQQIYLMVRLPSVVMLHKYCNP